MDTTVADPLIGSLLDGRYRIRGRVARGGMATVYHAVDERLERTVAVKIIHPAFAANPHFLARFDREAKLIARLAHPGVVAVYDSGQHQGLPYLVMEYIRGRTLRDVLAERGRLTAQQAVAVLEPVLAALAAAHAAGLVHRDVKPENVLIGDDGIVKVADFGLARAVEASSAEASPDETTGSQVMATVAYVPPELVAHGWADPRSDVYAAGIVLFEMLTGRLPYNGARAVDIAYQHVERDVPPPSRLATDIPAALDELVVRATRRDPGARPTDAGAFLAELRAVRMDLGIVAQAMPVSPGPRMVSHQTLAVPRPDALIEPPFRHQRPLPVRNRPRSGLIATIVIVILGLLVSFGGWWLGAGRYTEAPSLLTLDRAAAATKADQLGFSVKYDSGAFSETIPRDQVLRQKPGPGGRIVKGGPITVTLSLGPERHTVPDLRGKQRSEAEQTLLGMNLRVTVTSQYSQSVGNGEVISTNPKAGVVLKRDAPITLLVSKGRPPVTVPDVRGRKTDDAVDQLEGLDLQVKIVEKPSVEVDEGRVITQSPGPDAGVDKRTTVTLTVSLGPPKVVVPNLQGMTYEEAKQALEQARLKIRKAFDWPGGNNRVYSQTPGAASQADAGSTVTVFLY